MSVIVGTSASETLTGTNAIDAFYGKEGNDTLNGLGGYDYAHFSTHTGNASLAHGWTIDLIAGKASTTYLVDWGSLFGGFYFTETDTLNSIEGAYGSDKDDTFIMTSANQAFGLESRDTAYITDSGGSFIGRFDGGSGGTLLYENDTANLSRMTQRVIVNLDDTSTSALTGNVTTTNAAGVNRVMFKLLNVEDVVGTSGNDVLRGNAGANTLTGGAGNDRFVLSPGQTGLSKDSYFGDGGSDTIDGRLYGRGMFISLNADEEAASAGYETATTTVKLADLYSIENAIGSNFSDFIFGSDAKNILSGSNGNDNLFGNGAADMLTGGLGKDYLSGAGPVLSEPGASPPSDAFADVFVYTAIADSGVTASTSDIIADFNGTDLISLRTIDARAGTAVNENFVFAGKVAGNAITANSVGGRVAYYQSGGDTYVGLEVNGDTRFDSIIKLEGLITLNSADFIL